MKIVQPSVRIYPAGRLSCVMTVGDGAVMAKTVEQIGRTCYKSEHKIDGVKSHELFIRNLIAAGHESVLEHCSVTARIICDRGVSHEIVRHRIGAYTQESTRYCNYVDGRFGSEITVIDPSGAFGWDPEGPQYAAWKEGCEAAEHAYFTLAANGARPQEARDVLPNSLKTELWATYDLREWRHFIRLRASRRAHPQMRQIAEALLTEFYATVPFIFDDLHDEIMKGRTE